MRVRRGVMAPRVLIGGVGYRWQTDASLGVVASDLLETLDWPAEVQVMDLGYGALYAAQDIRALRPALEHLILIAAAEREREKGTLHHVRWAPREQDAELLQEQVREAGAGILSVDHLLAIAQHFDALPARVDVVEFEPVDVSPGVELSDRGKQVLRDVVATARLLAGAPEERSSWSSPTR